MMTTPRLLKFFLLLLAIASAPAVAVDRFDGELPDDLGRFAIDVPPGWQAGGRLLIYNHGFSMRFPEQAGPVDTAPDDESRAYLLEAGYALAAASYSDRGWALFDIEQVQAALLGEFRSRAGDPGEILLFGGSLGGLVSMRTAEAFAGVGEPVAGVLAVCPPLAGARTWDSAVDTRLLFDAVCPESPLPTGSSALPWVLDYAAIPQDLADITDGGTLESALSIANRIRQCAGFYQPSIFDTPAQLQRRAALKALLGISSDDFLLTNIAYAVYPLSDLIQAPTKLAGSNPFDNRFVDYGNAEVNARIRRVTGDPPAAVKLRAVSNLRGPFGAAKVLVLHSDRDELVVGEHVDVLAGLNLPREQLSIGLVRQDEVAHCDFSPSELLTGFESLRRWIDADDRPDTASLRADCLARPDRGDDRCGFDPEVTLGSLDAKIRPRGLEPRYIVPGHSGSWFDPQFDGEGLLIEVINENRDAIVGWYTYPPQGGDGEQRWIAGLGRISEDGIHVAQAREFRGARFGAFDPADIESSDWGELTLAFGGCDGPPLPGQSVPAGELRLRYAGPPAYGSGERSLQQLTQNAIDSPVCTEIGIPPLPEPASRYAGSWFRSDAPGDGWVLQIGADRSAVLGWYTFDPNGEAAWLLGTGQFDAQTRSVQLSVQRTRGARFGDDFRPEDVQHIDWGVLTLTFDSCNSGTASWDAQEPGWADGSVEITRLTRVDGTPDCDGE